MRVHLLTSPDPLDDGQQRIVDCGAKLKNCSFAPTGDKDWRFSELREVITCRKCLEIKNGNRYNYAAIDGSKVKVEE